MADSLQTYAQRLQEDISRRRLVPGSRYFTAEEGARMLGTSTATANRVLRILAEQEIVVRRRNSGTFVGPAVASAAVDDIHTVCILAPASSRIECIVRFDLIIQGILASLPDVVDVRVSYVPVEQSVDFVRNLLDSLRDSGKLAGVVAISCPREVYRYLGENKYPLVVMGSLYSDQPYPSIDTDERQAGQMLTDYLLKQNHLRLAVLSDSEASPGDNYFRDGVSESLTAAQRPHNALIWRAPGDPAVLQTQVKEMLVMPDRPTAFIVKLPRWADEVAAVVADHGLRVPQDVEIVFKGFALGEPGKSAFPHVRPSMPYRTIADTVGRMLAQVRDGAPLDKQTIVIPYQMRQSPETGVVD